MWVWHVCHTWTWQISQVQGSVGLARMPDPKHLDLAFSQVQDGVGLARMSDSMRLDLAISQVQDDWTWQCTKPKIVWV